MKATLACPKTTETVFGFARRNTDGGIILFGIDEKAGYKVCGIQNPDELEKKVVEQANEMEPVVRPLISFCEYEGKIVASAEIAEMDSVSKPCYYSGKGKSKGSYIRIGDADLPMTEYEIYSYDAFKYKTEDELRTNRRIDSSMLDNIQLDGFIAKAVSEKPNLDIVAVVCTSKEYAEESVLGERFLVNKRLDGTISQMLESGLSFVQQNMKVSTVIDETGHRKDVYEYPVKAVREIILNALIHRDYSIHTENDPIRIEMYPDRIEVSNPGGLYGRLKLDELGKTKADEKLSDKIIEFCRKPRSKEVLAKEFGFDEKHPAYFIKNYIIPLIDEGKLKYTISEKPKSKNQQIVRAD